MYYKTTIEDCPISQIHPFLQKLDSEKWIQSVECYRSSPATDDDISVWYKKYPNVKLPEEVLRYLKQSNGFVAKWCGEYKRNTKCNGSIELLSLSQIKPLKLFSEELLSDMEGLSQLIGNDGCLMNVDSISHIKKRKAFERLISTDFDVEDYCKNNGCGKRQLFEIADISDKGRVILSFTPDGKNEIWYQNSSFSFFKICSTMDEYIRLSLFHWCIEGWQNVFTTAGIGQNTYRMMEHVCPDSLIFDQELRGEGYPGARTLTFGRCFSNWNGVSDELS